MKKILYSLPLFFISCTSAVDQINSLKKPVIVIFKKEGHLFWPPGGSEMQVKDASGNALELSPYGLPQYMNYNIGDTIK